MAVLLTGLGYIGAALAQRLVHERGDQVVALENFYSTPREMVARFVDRLNGGHADQPRLQLIEGDTVDPRAVARLVDAHPRPTVLFLLAAQPSAAMAVRDPETTERSNLTGARVVLQAASERSIPVVFGGSFRVYGDDLSANHTVDERTPYGRVGDLSHLSKIYVEQLARMFGLPFASVRLGVVYGLSPIMKTVPAFMTVPNLFCQRAARGDVLQVLEDRPMAFIHVADAAEALLLTADQVTRTGGYQVANAAPEVATIGQLARTVQRLAQARGRWARVHGASISEAGFQVASSLHAFQPKQRLADSLGEVLEFFLDAG